MSYSKVSVLVAIAALLTCGIIGFLIGYFSAPKESDESNNQQQFAALTRDAYQDEEETILEQLLEQVNAENIKNNLRELSRVPHLAGQQRDNDLVHYIQKSWQESGLDHVELVPYNILLSYPNPQNPNKVHLLSETGKVLYESLHQEEVKRLEDRHPDFIHAFNAYSPNGEVTGDLVYVNYGRVEDFDKLATLNITVKNRICIIRYGMIFRGNKVQHAYERGALGVILFSDPADVAAEGTEPEKLYPNSWWITDTGMQRGTIYLADGDPLTPGWPSIEGAYRLNISEAHLPKILCQPIGYRDAKKFLINMGGPDPPEDWKGAIQGVKYKLGPGFNLANIKQKVRLTVNNELRNVVNYNVIGRIYGTVEPDRYVLLGNHRDAWGFGAVDPSSATAQTIETARVLGNMVRKGWRPRRTLVFCSWAAEEYGLLGSYEWVEDNTMKLMERAVAVVNTDECAFGPILRAKAAPTLKAFMYEATRKVRDPKDPSKSLYETWKKYYNQDSDVEKEPPVLQLSSGSDFAPFFFYSGVPGIDMVFQHDKKKYDVFWYPAYHTGYETFYLMEKYLDPGFKYHRTCGQLVIWMLKRLGDSLLIPMNMTQFGVDMQGALDDLYKSNISQILQEYGKLVNANSMSQVTLDLLASGVTNFTRAAVEFHERLTHLDKTNPLAVRIANDQMMQVERSFLIPTGLPSRPMIRHAIFASSSFDIYSSSGFPGITDLLYRFKELSSEEQKDRWTQLRRHISDVMITIRKATSFLQSVEVV